MIDYRNPDYLTIFKQRAQRLAQIRKDPKLLAQLKVHYKHNPADFINDWGVTFDPRNIALGLPPIMPFILFPKQIELIHWLIDLWHNQQSGGVEKSRDTGVSWTVLSLFCTLGIFYNGFSAGCGSRKEEYVDKLDAPKSLFYKARMFMRYLPVEFRAGWTLAKHAPHMRLIFPDTGSVITGEAGDGIGRGDRQAIYLVDESAHLERPELVEASLSNTTDCRIDVSSVNGMNNPFARKKHEGHIPYFIYDWTDDPRKDAVWYAKKMEELGPTVMAQEVDRNYNASIEGTVIPSVWILAALDAHIKLGIVPSGMRRGALDVADEGKDKNAFGSRHGILLDAMEVWSGKDSDIYATTERAHSICKRTGLTEFLFDSDGLGAGVRGDSRMINQLQQTNLEALAWRGSGEVINPDSPAIPLPAGAHPNDVIVRTNKDFYLNAKAQAWWELRKRFERTFNAVTKGMQYDPDTLISISKNIPDHMKLAAELSQPTWSENDAGKIKVDKKPDGQPSPNMADAVMMLYAPQNRRKVGVLGF